MSNKKNDFRSLHGNTIISGKDLLMMALVRFYKQNNNTHMSRIIPIIEGKSKISLRLIDWFVTNYSKKYNVIIPKKKKIQEENEMEYLNVYISYRQQLKAFSKQQFDPFRRRDRIKFFYNKENDWIETTIGQLNFFKWVLQNNILEYITQNMKLIEADMMTSQKPSSFPDKKGDKKNEEHQERHKNILLDEGNTINDNIDKKNKRGRKKREHSSILPKKNNKKINENTENSKQSKRNSLKNFNISNILNQSNMVVGPKIVKFD